MTTSNLSPEHRERLAALADLLDLMIGGSCFDLAGWLSLHTTFGFRLKNLHEWQTWLWVFSAEWPLKDNTPRGAAARIRYLLEHGLPENWREQMSGEAELCYRETATGGA